MFSMHTQRKSALLFGRVRRESSVLLSVATRSASLLGVAWVAKCNDENRAPRMKIISTLIKTEIHIHSLGDATECYFSLPRTLETSRLLTFRNLTFHDIHIDDV